MLVAQLPQLLEERRLGACGCPPSPWIGSIRMAAVSLADRRLDLRDVAERHAVEAGQNGPETFEMLLLATGGDGRHRAAVKGALEGDDPVALGLATPVVEPARHLDRALQRLGAGIAEERGVGERMRDQALGQALLRLDAVEIGAVPELLGLGLEHRHQVRMGVAEQGDRDAAAEVEIAAPGAIEQVGAFAALEGDLGPFVDRQQRRHRSIGHGGWVARQGLKKHHRCIAPACQRLAPFLAENHSGGGRHRRSGWVRIQAGLG